MAQASLLRRLARRRWTPLAALTSRSWPATLLARRIPAPLRTRIVGALGDRPLARSEATADCWGIRAKLALDDDVQRQIFFGLFEREELALLQSLVEPGDVCLDVGANVGFYTCHLGRLVGPSGHVFAFEPEPRNAERLAANVRLSGHEDRVTLERTALTHSVGRARFYRAAPHHSGWGSLRHYPEFHEDAIPVPTTTVDAFMRGREIRSAGLLKVDVEGGDQEVFEGARESLTRGAFRYVMAEWNGVWLPKRGITLSRFLEGFKTFGYRPAPWPGSAADGLLNGRLRPQEAIVNLVLGRDAAAGA